MRESAAQLGQMGARVPPLFYAGDRHLVGDDEAAAAREILRAVAEAA